MPVLSLFTADLVLLLLLGAIARLFQAVAGLALAINILILIQLFFTLGYQEFNPNLLHFNL